MSSSLLASFLQALLLLGSLLTVGKLWLTGLWRRYPALFVYFLLLIPHRVWPLLVDIRSTLYAKIWVITSPLFLVLHILVVFELYRLVLTNYRGLSTILRWAVVVFSGISLAISLGSMGLFSGHVASKLRLTFATERGIDSSLAVFMILLLLLLGRYPVRLSRNVKLYAVIFPVFFIGNTLGILLRVAFNLDLASEANTILAVVTTGCVYGWVFLLSKEGEAAPAPLPKIGEEDQQRLLTQLDALNSTLMRASRN
jgi:hypothetical protein